MENQSMELRENSNCQANPAFNASNERAEIPRISVRGLSLSREEKQFAMVPDFDVGAGQSVALVGASGSGKTTALMAMAGIRRPSTGKVMIDGEDPWTLGSRARDMFRGWRIGLVFQTFHLVDALSVAANIRLAAQCAGHLMDARLAAQSAGHAIDEAGRLDMLLEKLDLVSIRARRADHISHGQAQRVAIARALFNRPSVILADEPTSALDDTNTSSLLELLNHSAASEQAALVIATHDRRVLQAVDRVVTMEKPL